MAGSRRDAETPALRPSADSTADAALSLSVDDIYLDQSPLQRTQRFSMTGDVVQEANISDRPASLSAVAITASPPLLPLPLAVLSSPSSPSLPDTGNPDAEIVVESDDPSHLFWVPAHQHPEIAPQAFRDWLSKHDFESHRDAVSRIRRRKSYRESAHVLSTDLRGSLVAEDLHEFGEHQTLLETIGEAPGESIVRRPVSTSLRRMLRTRSRRPPSPNLSTEIADSSTITIASEANDAQVMVVRPRKLSQKRQAGSLSLSLLPKNLPSSQSPTEFTSSSPQLQPQSQSQSQLQPEALSMFLSMLTPLSPLTLSPSWLTPSEKLPIEAPVIPQDTTSSNQTKIQTTDQDLFTSISVLELPTLQHIASPSSITTNLPTRSNLYSTPDTISSVSHASTHSVTMNSLQQPPLNQHIQLPLSLLTSVASFDIDIDSELDFVIPPTRTTSLKTRPRRETKISVEKVSPITSASRLKNQSLTVDTTIVHILQQNMITSPSFLLDDSSILLPRIADASKVEPILENTNPVMPTVIAPELPSNDTYVEKLYTVTDEQIPVIEQTPEVEQVIEIEQIAPLEHIQSSANSRVLQGSMDSLYSGDMTQYTDNDKKVPKNKKKRRLFTFGTDRQLSKEDVPVLAPSESSNHDSVQTTIPDESKMLKKSSSWWSVFKSNAVSGSDGNTSTPSERKSTDGESPQILSNLKENGSLETLLPTSISGAQDRTLTDTEIKVNGVNNRIINSLPIPTSTGSPTPAKKPKSVLSIFKSSRSKSTVITTTSEVNGISTSTGNTISNPIKPRPRYTSYTRYPIHIERAICRLAHQKLANPRRALRHQVQISNMLVWYMSLRKGEEATQHGGNTTMITAGSTGSTNAVSVVPGGDKTMKAANGSSISPGNTYINKGNESTNDDGNKNHNSNRTESLVNGTSVTPNTTTTTTNNNNNNNGSNQWRAKDKMVVWKNGRFRSNVPANGKKGKHRRKSYRGNSGTFISSNDNDAGGGAPSFAYEDGYTSDGRKMTAQQSGRVRNDDKSHMNGENYEDEEDSDNTSEEFGESDHDEDEVVRSSVKGEGIIIRNSTTVADEDEDDDVPLGLVMKKQEASSPVR